jgi:hypothetical protein
MPEPTVIVRMEEDVQMVMCVPEASPGGLSGVWVFRWNVRKAVSHRDNYRDVRCLFAMP